jgi:hypothetical protein
MGTVYYGHTVALYGFPRDKGKLGIPAEGLIKDGRSNGTVEMLAAEQTGFPVEAGFSGGPVWDRALGRVVGMVVHAASDRTTGASFFIPAASLVNADSDLHSSEYAGEDGRSREHPISHHQAVQAEEEELARLALQEATERHFGPVASGEPGRKADLTAQLHAANDTLSQFERSNADPNRRYLNLEAKLAKLDFMRARSIVAELLHRFGQQGYVVLFVIQRSLLMGGELCVAAIRELLEDSTSDFKHWQIAFTDQADEWVLINRLANYVNEVSASTSRDLKVSMQHVVSKIMGSIQGGSTVFIELANCDLLRPPERVFPWFLQDFWSQVVDDFRCIAEQWRAVKLVVVMSADDVVPPVILSSPLRTRTVDQFKSGSIIELPLRRWTQEEIGNWLGSYYSQLKRAEIEGIAQSVYNASAGGTPNVAYDALRKRLREF